MESHLPFFIAGERSGRIADFDHRERNSMCEETNDAFRINRLSRRKFLGVGTTILAAAAGRTGLPPRTKLQCAQENSSGRPTSEPEPEQKSLLNEDAKSGTPPQMEFSDVVKGLLC
jgi:hypothetical protein